MREDVHFIFAETDDAEAEDPDYAIARPYLEKLAYLAIGSGKEGDFVTSKIVLGLTAAAWRSR